MSSIDKGVEQVVNRLGRNVRVVKRGNTIYGYMNGEVVFSLADRYGYINTREEQIIRDGIRRYDEEERLRRERAAAERRAREEAIRRAREEAERQRRAQLEAERKRAHAAVISAINEKRSEYTRAIEIYKKTAETVAKNMASRRAETKKLTEISSLFDLSELERENSRDEVSQRAVAENDTASCREALAEFERFASSVKADMTTEQYNELVRRVRKFSAPTPKSGSGAYENGKFMDKLRAIRAELHGIMPAVSELERLSREDGEVGIIAREALGAISARKISNSGDALEFARIAQTRLSRVSELRENDAIAADINEISRLGGAIAACKNTYEIVASATYHAKDHRKEIEEKAESIKAGYSALLSAEYTTASSARINEINSRLETILSRGEKSEDVLRELERMESELSETAAVDKLHEGEYREYLETVNQLREYGVDSSRIEAFSPLSYAEQKRELTAALSAARRDFERSQLIITDLHVKNVMDEMGYELFSTVGDAEGYVREALFTKPGYDGVLWQAIIYANGSVTRRIIGVNKGETETDTEYIKEVAAEMENAHDPETFITKFRDATGSSVAVNSAVEHDSEGADAEIAKNGYHYLRGEALELYEQRVAERITSDKPAKAPTRKKQQQRRIVAGKAIASSANALNQAAMKSRAMSHAN